MITNTEKIWLKVRELNEKSHIYSEVADELTKLAQEIEGINDEN